MPESDYQITLTRPHVFLLRMLLFLTLTGFIGLVLYEQISRAFMANPGLNGLILLVLFIGILYGFRQVLRLYPEIRWVNSFRIADPGFEMPRPPVLLAPMATMLRDRRGQVSLSTFAMRSIMDSIGTRLDEAHDTARYLVGLLIFLGLLGTFWGLLETINSVGTTISSLNTGSGDSLVIFEELKSGLQAPLGGMGTAFSSSLFGLAGSLVLGFLDLQANQAQNRFYNELEDWLSGITRLHTVEALEEGGDHVHNVLSGVRQNLSGIGEKISSGTPVSTRETVTELARGIEALVTHIRSEQETMRRWLDEQASQQAELKAVLRELSSGRFIEEMRVEQQIIREWADAQAAQQSEISMLLRKLLEQLEG